MSTEIVDNELTIVGPKLRVLQAMRFVRGPHELFDPSCVIPLPEMGDTPEWRHDNWGTEGVDYCREWRRTGETKGHLSASLIFGTAWSSPLPVVEALGKIFPDLEFDLYAEDLGEPYHIKPVPRGRPEAHLETRDGKTVICVELPSEQ